MLPSCRREAVRLDLQALRLGLLHLVSYWVQPLVGANRRPQWPHRVAVNFPLFAY